MSLVRHGLVLAGLIITKFFGAAIGISAFATAELYGPTMPRNLLSSSICRTLATPASALYAPCRQSSKLWYVMVKPSTVPFCWIANLTPFAVAWPPMVHTGRSEPILMVPLLVPPPVLPPQAKATRVAAVRTISPLARTIWFPLCAGWEGNAQTTPNASHHLPPSSQLGVGARVRRRRVRPHGMAELLLRGTLSTRRAPQVKSKLRPASAWGRDQ